MYQVTKRDYNWDEEFIKVIYEGEDINTAKNTIIEDIFDTGDYSPEESFSDALRKLKIEWKDLTWEIFMKIFKDIDGYDTYGIQETKYIPFELCENEKKCFEKELKETRGELEEF